MENKEMKVKGREDVLIEYTAKCKFHKPGTQVTVHRLQAEKLIEKGFAAKAKSKK